MVFFMYYLGIDLGGTNIVSAVVDENNKIIARAKEKTNAPRPAEEIFDDIYIDYNGIGPVLLHFGSG